MSEKMNAFLQGDKITLRSFKESDFDYLDKWLNDPVVTHTMFYGQLPMTRDQVREMIMNQINDSANIVFIILDPQKNTPIGFCGMYGIHLTAQKAEYRILIGETEYWGKGYGTEVTELLLLYGFDRLNLHRIWLGVTVENERAVGAYKKAGYKEEGRLRDDIYRNSRYYDSIRMSVIRDEYYTNLHKKFEKKFLKVSD